MERWSEIYSRAVARHGGEEAVEERLPTARTRRRLSSTPAHRYLAEMGRCIFRSGFVWRVVEAKWPGFEEVFHGFEPEAVAAMDDDALHRLMEDKRVIRNWRKILAVRDNATFILDTAAEHGSFARFVSHWPTDDIVGLWLHLKQEARRLGGDTGPMFLRGVGKDTFMLSRDVVGYLVDQEVVEKKPTGKGDLRAVQEAFNRWAEESGRPLCQISRLIAMSWGEVH